MAKKSVEYKETYKKGVIVEKQQFINLLNKPDTEVHLINAGRYDDGKEFITIMLDNLSYEE